MPKDPITRDGLGSIAREVAAWMTVQYLTFARNLVSRSLNS
jgi:hypothetical protein